MRLIVGLGNTGNRYARTRHNVGFLVLNHYTQNKRIRFEHKPKLGAEIAKDNEIIYAKPITMMNRSGQAVRSISDYYDIDVKDILIVYDELALPFGTLRARKGGESAGHNGIKSIINHLKSDAFLRLRVGIDSPHSANGPAEKFVLSDFSKDEQRTLPEIFKLSEPIIAKFVSSGELEAETVKITPQE